MFGRSILLAVAAWAAFAAFLRVAVVPPEGCPAISAERAEQTAVAAQGWMQRAQGPDGRYVYEYDADHDAVSSDYSVVRHAGVTMALYQASGRHRDSAALRTADTATAWMTSNLVRTAGWAALSEPGTDSAPLGASALMLVGLTERRLVTGEFRFDPLMRELGGFLVSMQRPDGGFDVTWVISPRRAGPRGHLPLLSW